jgi:hypothetical protein
MQASMPALLDASNVGDIVLDPFCGSGSILLAAERTQRIACASELDPKFVDVAVTRMRKLTGEYPVHEERVSLVRLGASMLATASRADSSSSASSSKMLLSVSVSSGAVLFSMSSNTLEVRLNTAGRRAELRRRRRWLDGWSSPAIGRLMGVTDGENRVPVAFRALRNNKPYRAKRLFAPSH